MLLATSTVTVYPWRWLYSLESCQFRFYSYKCLLFHMRQHMPSFMRIHVTDSMSTSACQVIKMKQHFKNGHHVTVLHSPYFPTQSQTKRSPHSLFLFVFAYGVHPKSVCSCYSNRWMKEHWPTASSRQFPEMMKHELPQKWGTLSATGFRTPSYNYGWIMPILNLLKSLQREDLMNEEVTPNNAECCAIIPKWNQEYAAQFGYVSVCSRFIFLTHFLLGCS